MFNLRLIYVILWLIGLSFLCLFIIFIEPIVDPKIIPILLGIFSLLLAIMHCCYLHKLSFASPLVLHVIGWIPTFLFGIFWYKDFFAISFFAIFIWLVWFWVVYIIMFFFIPKISQCCISSRSMQLSLSNIPPIKYKYGVIILFLIILFLKKVLLIISYGLSQPGVILRMANTGQLEGDEFNLGVFNYLEPLMLILLFWEYATLSKDNYIKYVLLLIWNCLFFVASMSKFALFKPLLGLLIIRNIKKPINIWGLVGVLGGVSIAVWLTQYFRTSIGTESLGAGQLLAIYLFAPLVAFSNIVDGNIQLLGNVHHFGFMVFRFLYSISKSLRISDIDPVVSLLPFTYVPYGGNVYTILFSFYFDFGFVGVLLFAIGFGLLFATIYHLALRGNVVFLIYYLCICSILITEFFAETFFGIFSLNIQLFLWCYIVLFFVRKF